MNRKEILQQILRDLNHDNFSCIHDKVKANVMASKYVYELLDRGRRLKNNGYSLPC